MSGSHEGKVAIVTGAGRGLGRAMSLALLGAGAKVALIDVDEKVLEETAAACGAPERALTLVADVSLDGSAPEIVRQTVSRFGRLDILVNNAGVGIDQLRAASAPSPQFYWDVTPSEFRRLYEINTVSFFLMTLAALPEMRARKWGRVLNVTTSLDTMFRLFPYGGTKAANEAHTVVLAKDLEGSGVTANVLIPGGAVNTRMTAKMFKDDARAKLIQPDVMMAPLLWLTSNEADRITGRRFVAADWDSSLPGRQAAERCSAPAAWPGLGRPPRAPD